MRPTKRNVTLPVRLIALLLVGAACALVPTSASAATVKERVRALNPPGLYPSSMPSAYSGVPARFQARGGPHYWVTWNRGVGQGYINLQRDPRSAYAQTVRDARSSTATRIGNRSVRKVCGHVCGYIWRTSSFTYGVYGIDYRRSDAGLAQLRAVVRALR